MLRNQGIEKRVLVDGKHGRLMDEAYVGAVANKTRGALSFEWLGEKKVVLDKII